jgi:hypothetical protein
VSQALVEHAACSTSVVLQRDAVVEVLMVDVLMVNGSQDRNVDVRILALDDREEEGIQVEVAFSL